MYDYHYFFKASWEQRKFNHVLTKTSWLHTTNKHSHPTCGVFNGSVPVERRSDSKDEEKPCSKEQHSPHTRGLLPHSQNNEAVMLTCCVNSRCAESEGNWCALPLRRLREREHQTLHQGMGVFPLVGVAPVITQQLHTPNDHELCPDAGMSLWWPFVKHKYFSKSLQGCMVG